LSSSSFFFFFLLSSICLSWFSFGVCLYPHKLH
jgi:hypothetical protein